MKCPECIKGGKKSIVTKGYHYTGSSNDKIQWDEDGNLISIDYKTITDYYCSNEHYWSETVVHGKEAT